MRYAQIDDGKVTNIFDGHDLKTLEGIFPGSEFAECNETITTGTPYPFPVVEPTPEPEAPAQSLDSVKSELEQLIAIEKQKYLAPWPTLSQQELWPLLKTEIAQWSDAGSADPLKYPALYAFLGVPDEDVTITMLDMAAKGINEKIRQHTQMLKKAEDAYQAVLSEFMANGVVDVSAKFYEVY